MARISDQIREIALVVCDRLAAYENSTADGEVPSLPILIDQAGDSDLEILLRDAAAVRSEFDAIIAAGAGIVAKRSERELGYAGLAQRTGHRTPVAMVQSLTGSTRTEAARQVPPSQCEAHHIDEWAADGGCTDLADGMLFCRHHHMLLHNNGWRIVREGSVYWMIPPASVDPEQKPILLTSKSALRVFKELASEEAAG